MTGAPLPTGTGTHRPPGGVTPLSLPKTAAPRRRRNRQRRMKRKAWLIRRQKKILRHKHRAGRQQPFDSDRWLGLPLNEHTKDSVSIEDGKLVIHLPNRLDFEDNYEQTASHLQLLRKAVRDARPVRRLEFDDLEFISPSAALVLASEVDRWNQKVRGRLKANVDTWKTDIKRLLRQMGYFDLLNIEEPDEPLPSGKMTFLRFIKGEVTDLESAQLAKKLRVEIENVFGLEIQKQFLFEGLSEAITNVGQHAYQQTNFFTVQQWWVSASFDSENRILCVTFYDQGVGIPITLPKSKFFEHVRDVFSGWTDSRKIKAAMEIGRTSTGRTERGKGLQNFIEFAKSHREGQLSIYSLRGRYRENFYLDSSADRVPSELRDYQNSIGGTLIEWSVKL